MPTRDEVSYFGAGPAPLPTSVLHEASENLLSYKDSGIGLAEISHRSPEANEILASAKSSLVQLLNIPDDYEVLFMQGGGSGEFSAVVYNLVGVWVQRMKETLEETWKGTGMETASEEEKLAEYKRVTKAALRLEYLVTGSWTLKASQEAAKLVGEEHVHIVTDARKHNDGKFGVIPEETSWSTDIKPAPNGILSSLMTPALTYYCDNETVDGVEFPSFPKSLESKGQDHDRLVVADMSSNFLSRKIDVSKYAVIFGGAQKNVGSTGITIVIVRKSLLPPKQQIASPHLLRSLGLPNGPVVLDYATIAKNNSLYNTLPIFDVWIAGRVMANLVSTHSAQRIAGQEVVSNKKASLLYSTIDKHSDVYQVVPSKGCRSRMNICMRIRKGDAEAEKSFLKGAEELNLKGLKGHRSVGGIRISNYNAVEVKAVEKLEQYLESFAQIS
ncbi:MAG: Phosphoserine transaminase [Chrysothrix sp. TS-e1954]|nr:MAG: Phosphoserine transaminase [Chrysothrix sp. TS-e1954]